MKLVQLWRYVFFLSLAASPLLAFADDSAPGHSGDGGSGTCARSDGQVTPCDDPGSYEPTACELGMQEIWNSAQGQIEQLLTDPICADFGAEPGVAVTELGSSDATLKGPNGRFVLVKKRALRALRRKARKQGC